MSWSIDIDDGWYSPEIQTARRKAHAMQMANPGRLIFIGHDERQLLAALETVVAAWRDDDDGSEELDMAVCEAVDALRTWRRDAPQRHKAALDRYLAELDD